MNTFCENVYEDITTTADYVHTGNSMNADTKHSNKSLLCKSVTKRNSTPQSPLWHMNNSATCKMSFALLIAHDRRYVIGKQGCLATGFFVKGCNSEDRKSK